MKAKSKSKTNEVKEQANIRKLELQPKAPQPTPITLDYREFNTIRELMEALGSTTSRSVIDCEDMASAAYKKAGALLRLIGLAGYGLGDTESTLDCEVFEDAVDSIRLQLEIGRLASKTLFKHCERLMDEKQ